MCGLLNIILSFCLVSASVACSGCRHKPSQEAIWINSGATAPALPVYAALSSQNAPALTIRQWDSPLILNNLLFKGEGPYWLASVDTIARAYSHGAPIRLLVVTGWRKFHLVSSRPSDRFPDDFIGRPLPYAPPGSPGYSFLQHTLEKQNLAQPQWQPHENRQLLLKLLGGQMDCALLPEPFATILLFKAPQFHRIMALEEYIAEITGGSPRLPWAAIAVSLPWADEHPEEVRLFMDEICFQAQYLAGLPPEKAAEYLPGQSDIPREILAKSLEHDIIDAIQGTEIKDELKAFLGIAVPDFTWDDAMLWNVPSP